MVVIERVVKQEQGEGPVRDDKILDELDDDTTARGVIGGAVVVATRHPEVSLTWAQEFVEMMEEHEYSRGLFISVNGFSKEAQSYLDRNGVEWRDCRTLFVALTTGRLYAIAVYRFDEKLFAGIDVGLDSVTSSRQPR